jgi:integrase
MMARTEASGPATRERPGPGTGGESHAESSLPVDAMSAAEQTTKHAGIFKRGNRYTARVRDRRGRVRRVSGQTIAEVKAKRAAFETDVARGEWRAASRVTFAEYAADWLDTYTGRTGRGIRPATLADYRRTIEREAVPFFGRMPLAAIEPRDIRRYIAGVKSRGVSANTVRLAVAPVRALCATALEDGVIRVNPCAGIRLPGKVSDEDGRQVRALTAGESGGLLEQTPERWRLLVRLLLETGLRISEALALTWADVDLGRKRVQVRRRLYRGTLAAPKSRYGRRDVPLSDDLARALWARRGVVQAAQDADPVFASSTGGTVNAANLANRVLKPAARTAGVGWASWHTLRHTCATELFRRGLNAKQIQLWMGHHSPAFTLSTYVHLIDDDLPDSPFGVAGGNEVGTQQAETRRTAKPAEAPQIESASRIA